MIFGTSGLLALDVNGNGRIDGGAELFGTATTDGFTILAQYDSNGDNQITRDDAIWDRLLIWRDGVVGGIAADGISTREELSSLDANNIISINLNDRAPTRFERFREGNGILGISDFVSASGPSGLAGTNSAEVIAAAFQTDVTNTRFIIPDDFEYDPAVFSLPNLRGYGDVPDLWTAMSRGPVRAFGIPTMRAVNAAWIVAANDDEPELQWKMAE